MANNPQQPDPHEEAEFQRLLSKVYVNSDPPVEFQQSLLRRLDEEFAKTYLQESSAGSVALEVTQPEPLLNGTIQAASQSPSPEISVESITGPRQRAIGLRVAMTMAMAASMLFAVALWNSQNAYGWASMLRALENSGWVQAVSETAGLSGWVSSQRGIVAIRSEDTVTFRNHFERSSAEYFPDRQVVYQQALPSTGEASTAEELISLLLHDSSAESSNLSANVNSFTVVSESWREVEALGDRGASIELLVTLRGPQPERELHKVVVLVDPETHLPKMFRLLSNNRGASKTLAFSYPAEGPKSIFALGVPRETQVIMSLADLDKKKLAVAQDAEVSRQLGRVNEFAEKPTGKPAVALRLAEKTESKVLDLTPAEKKQLEKDKPKVVTAPPTSRLEVGEVVDHRSKDEPVGQPKEQTNPSTEQRVASVPQRPVVEAPAVLLPEQPTALTELVSQINDQLAASWRAQGVTPAEPASDAEFLRRVYLDLAGRIPIPFEVYDFLEDVSPERRERLVDELLASRDHATHLATVWRKLLLPEGANTSLYGGTGKFDEWLADRFQKNVPYDQLVSELLLAEGRVSDSGPILFYAALKLNPEELAAKTARTFLGMRMECAQCHDHPFDEAISQEDFWGFAAHFAQISRPRGKIEMTSSVLRVRDNKRGEVMLPDSDEVVPPRMPYAVKVPAPAEEGRSRREQLVDWLTTKQNSRFARATVNRAWQHLFGRGLVEPVDDMRVDNPATCPEVLETLSLDFASSGYDLRRLLRALVLSDAYQLSSRAATDEPSQSLVFARMNVKSFTADQLYDCINVATQPEGMNGGNTPDGALARFGNTPRQAFIEQFQAPPGQRTDYHAGIPQALTLMHGYLVHGATDLNTSGLLKSLNAPFMADEQRVSTLFLATLSRYPDEFEKEKMLAHLNASSDDQERSRALGDVLWALLNSAEFTFIH